MWSILRLSVTASEDSTQAIYREAQLALRAAIGGFELDALLSDKNGVAAELEATLRQRAAQFGVTIISLGIRDVLIKNSEKK
ncbi:putative inner membrane protein, band 7 family [Desulfosarcina variabilis str. Montpellier]